MNKCVSSFKSYTARKIIDYLQKQQAETLLKRLSFAKLAHKLDREYQFWQEGVHAELVFSEAMMSEKLDYIHANPVKRGYVNLPEHWRYSSASNYAGQTGLMVIDVWLDVTLVSLGLHSHVERVNDKLLATTLNMIRRKPK